MSKQNRIKKGALGLLLVVALLACVARSAKASSITNRSTIDVAITVDDLPIGSGEFRNGERRKTLKRMIEVFQQHGLTKVYGFVNSTDLDDWSEVNKMLQDWLRAGFLLGNHTHSHPALSDTTATEYIGEIKKTDAFLANLGVDQKTRRVFRYPFLQEGNTLRKREAVRRFFEKNGYEVAPVTFDGQDHHFNELYAEGANNGQARAQAVQDGVLKAASGLTGARKLATKIFGRDVKHIMLMHLASINVEMLDQILTQLETQGARFVTLEEAMSDPVYKLNPGQAARDTGTFLTEMAYAAGLEKDPKRKSNFEPAAYNSFKAKMCESLFTL